MGSRSSTSSDRAILNSSLQPPSYCAPGTGRIRMTTSRHQTAVPGSYTPSTSRPRVAPSILLHALAFRQTCIADFSVEVLVWIHDEQPATLQQHNTLLYRYGSMSIYSNFQTSRCTLVPTRLNALLDCCCWFVVRKKEHFSLFAYRR